MPVHCRIDAFVATITLDAPESLNALTVDELLGLRRLLVDCQSDDAVRVIVLTGAGERAFCAGANLKATMPTRADLAAGLLKSRTAEAAEGGYTRLVDLTDLDVFKPMIAAVNGYCLGGGLELALQCDLRIASETASFALPEAKVGSVPAAGGVQFLLRAIPAAHAMKLALTGERIDAAQALRIGLVSDVVPADRLQHTAAQLARTIACNAPSAVQVIRKLAVETAHMAPRQFVRESNLHWALLRDSADRIEGRLAFADKRPPRYALQVTAAAR